MTSLFLEPFSGISGDMLNGLLVDLGADVELLHTELEKLGVDGFHLHVHRVTITNIITIMNTIITIPTRMLAVMRISTI